MRFKQGTVLARADERGELVVEDGRVEIRFREGDPRAYHASVRNLDPVASAPLLPDDACPPGAAPPARDGRGGASGGTSGGARGRSAPTRASAGAASHAVPDDAVVVYADGACSGNPGPAGVGVVLIDGKRRRELSHYLGHATNNVAELTAIKLAAEAIDDPRRPVRMFTDSQYAIGVLRKGWKAKANVELVAQVRAQLSRLQNVDIHYVRGHSGVVLNERADALAVLAVSERRTDGWQEL